MSEDLDKMMSKLKSKKKETPKEDPVEEEDQDDDEEEEEEEEEEETPAQSVKNIPKKADLKEKSTAQSETPKEEDQTVSVEQEIAILQNNGIFRREILGAVRELINVQMVTAQSLIDLNKLITGALNGKKK